jgi:hypothetical protein
VTVFYTLTRENYARVTNALAYNASSIVTHVKCFTVQAQDSSNDYWKFFFLQIEKLEKEEMSFYLQLNCVGATTFGMATFSVTTLSTTGKAITISISGNWNKDTLHNCDAQHKSAFCSGIFLYYYAECCIFYYAECRYSECRYSECRYSECRIFLSFVLTEIFLLL